MNRARRSLGFSLLELLVVVFIIGILATMMTLSIGTTGGDRELQKEVDRLAAILDLAAEEAVVQGREIGLKFYLHRYEFSAETWETTEAEEQEKTIARWAVIADDKLLKPRAVSDDLSIELELEGRSVLLKSWDQKEASQEAQLDAVDSTYEPQVFLLSSGDVTPFTLRLRRRFENDGITLTVEPDGSIEQTNDDV